MDLGLIKIAVLLAVAALAVVGVILAIRRLRGLPQAVVLGLSAVAVLGLGAVVAGSV